MATEAIFSSVERCPTILRQALKMVWKRVSTKFPTDVSALRVLSGYVPAIVMINNVIIIFIKCYIIFEEFSLLFSTRMSHTLQ